MKRKCIGVITVLLMILLFLLIVFGNDSKKLMPEEREVQSDISTDERFDEVAATEEWDTVVEENFTEAENEQQGGDSVETENKQQNTDDIEEKIDQKKEKDSFNDIIDDGNTLREWAEVPLAE